MMTNGKMFAACVVSCVWSLGAATEIYVSPQGKTDGVGSERNPFATLEQARDAVRAERKIKPNEAFTVVLQPGTYALTNSFLLTEADSGQPDQPVVYRAAVPGRARIYGGITLPKASFSVCTDEADLKRIPAAARGHVLVCDLSTKIAGTLQEVPNAFRGVITAPFLFANGEPKVIARWPNAGVWATFTKATDDGLAPKNPINAHKPRKAHPGAFVFDDARIAQWNMANGVWLHGYWTHDWSDEVIKVASYDAKTHEFRLAAAHGYGIAAGTWGRKERRFYALNLLAELDAPGEWYLDRSAKKLFFYPGKTDFDGEVVLTTMLQPLIDVRKVKHVTFQGLTFAYAHGIGVSIRDGVGVAVEQCRVFNIARDGISISGRENSVRSCRVYNIGATAITINGGDRKNLINANNIAENNLVYKFGQFTRTYAGAFGLYGCGNVLRHNVISEGPHLAVAYSGNEHVIEFNEIYNVLQETGDAGAFYSGRDWTSQGNKVRYNYFHDIGGGGQGQNEHIMSIYLDDCDCGDTLQGNLFLRAGRAIFMGGGRDNIVVGNLVLDSVVGIHLDSRGMTWPHWNRPDDGWYLEGKAMEMNYKNPPWSTRYPWLAATMDNAPKEPLGNVFKNNLVIDSKSQALSFDKNVRDVFPKLESANNIVVDSVGTNKKAQLQFTLKGFSGVQGEPGKPLDVKALAEGAGLRAFKKNAAVMQLMPALAEIPVEKIGLCDPSKLAK